MNSNFQELQKKLIAAARAETPSDRVPYAFEQRIMANLLARPGLDNLGLWARSLWRAAAPCVAVSALICLWSVLPYGQAGGGEPSLSQDFENTVYAALEQQLGETW